MKISIPYPRRRGGICGYTWDNMRYEGWICATRKHTRAQHLEFDSDTRWSMRHEEWFNPWRSLFWRYRTRLRGEMTYIPRLWGIATYEINRDAVYLMPIPLNLFYRILRYWWFRIKYGR